MVKQFLLIFFFFLLLFFNFKITAQALLPPTILTPIVHSSRAVTFRWQDNSQIEDYFKLYFVVGKSSAVLNIPPNSTSVKIEDLFPNTEYAVKVCAVKAQEEICSDVSPTIVTLAEKPTNLQAKASLDRLLIWWNFNFNSPSTEYFVENLTTKENSGWKRNINWFLSKNLECSQNYTFRIKARNKNKIETEPVEKSFSTLPCPIVIYSSTSTQVKISPPPLIISIFKNSLSFLKETVKHPEKTLERISAIPQNLRQNKILMETIKKPEVKNPIIVGSTIGIGVAILSGISGLMPYAKSLKDFSYLLFRISTFFPIFKKKYWGVVYDSVTKQPLDPVVLILKNKEKKEIESKITDMEGRFGFLVKEGEYFIEAQKTNYKFPSERIKGKEDVIYTNIYHGELLTVQDPQIINVDIPLDPVGFDWNEIAKKKYIKFNYYGEVFKKIFPEFLFFFGFILNLGVWVLQPTTFNFLLTIMYIVLTLLRILGFKPRTWGFVLDKKKKKPIPFAALRIFFEKLPHEIKTVFSDERGRYWVLLKKGKYDIIVEQRIISSEKEDRKFLRVIKGVKVKKGVLNKDIFV